MAKNSDNKISGQSEPKPSKICDRRSTTAGGLLFAVDNAIVEVGGDFLEKLDRNKNKSTSIPQKLARENVGQSIADTANKTKNTITPIILHNDFDPFRRLKNQPFQYCGRPRSASTDSRP